MNKQTLADRMKQYEQAICGQVALPQLPVIIRLDGRAFHSYTHMFERPYDKDFSKLMVETTKFLVEETNAKIGYTQSDEISLILHSDNPKSQIFFNGKFHKLNSICASMCTLKFDQLAHVIIKEVPKSPAYFDCRSWMVPTKEEATNYLLWRERDATKNSINSAAQSVFSHKTLQNLNTDELQDKLWKESDINWNDYPAFFKRGTYIQHKKVSLPLSDLELDKLPSKHNARKNPDMAISRNVIDIVNIEPFSTIYNKVDFVFDGEHVIYYDELERHS